MSKKWLARWLVAGGCASILFTGVAISPAIENGDRINIEAGFIKPSDGLKTYTDLFTNEYLK